MHQFSFLPIGCGFAVVCNNKYFGVGDGLAHRSRVRIDQRRIEKGRTERFGQPIHRKQLRLRKVGAQARHQINSQRAATIGQTQ